MIKNGIFNKGNTIIEYGKVYEIFDVEESESNGISETIVHYKPLFTTDYNISLTCSIPEKNISSSNIRKPVTLSKLNEILDFLSERNKEDSEIIDLLYVEDRFRLNDIYESVRVIKQCIANQKKIGEPFNFEKKGVLRRAIDMVLEEVAFVNNLELDAAYHVINSAAKNYYNKIRSTITK